jgi:DNA-binding NarL/FixJ family response regulator
LNEKDDRDKAIAIGANGFIPKTEFSPSELVSEVSRFLRQFEAQKRNSEHLTNEENDSLRDGDASVSEKGGM